MKICTVSPLYFEKCGATVELVSKVWFHNFPRRSHYKLWHSAPDVTVQELCEQVGTRFGADRVDFQLPLWALETYEFHAGDYL